ncbi:MAG: DUF1800 family protein [bacterium]
MTADKWNWATARHLLNRAGFGGKPSEIAAFEKVGRDGSVEALFELQNQPQEMPDWLAEDENFSAQKFRSMSQAERKKLQRRNRKRMRELQLAWVNRMIATRTPAEMLAEKMTFFWHGHFATSVQKVKHPLFVFKQLHLFHEHATGSFRDLLLSITRDPAMLRYLDNNQNRKGKPNENFARELVELFSLGPGHYNEQDVKEAARAFTGWSNDRFNFKFRTAQHDFGQKTFLGQTGDFDGQEVVNIILDQPACAEFMTRKILGYFGFEPVSGTVVRDLADAFRNSDYDIKTLLRRMFAHDDFYTSQVMGSQIKSPVQLVVGTARTLDLRTDNETFYLHALDMMGQVPYVPPNVKGWPGGRTWIDTSRLLTRFTFAQIVTQGKIPAEIDPRSEPNARRERGKVSRPRRDKAARKMMRMGHLRLDFEPESLASPQGSPDETLGGVARILLSQEMTAQERAMILANYQSSMSRTNKRQALRYLIGDIMTLPAYQLV